MRLLLPALLSALVSASLIQGRSIIKITAEVDTDDIPETPSTVAYLEPGNFLSCGLFTKACSAQCSCIDGVATCIPGSAKSCTPYIDYQGKRRGCQCLAQKPRLVTLEDAFVDQLYKSEPVPETPDGTLSLLQEKALKCKAKLWAKCEDCCGCDDKGRALCTGGRRKPACDGADKTCPDLISKAQCSCVNVGGVLGGDNDNYDEVSAQKVLIA